MPFLAVVSLAVPSKKKKEKKEHFPGLPWSIEIISFRLTNLNKLLTVTNVLIIRLLLWKFVHSVTRTPDSMKMILIHPEKLSLSISVINIKSVSILIFFTLHLL